MCVRDIDYKSVYNVYLSKRGLRCWFICVRNIVLLIFLKLNEKSR